MASLEGRVIAITGAASGIGKATAHLLAARGASISIADVRQEPLEEALASIQKSTPNAKIYHKAVNVAKADEVGAWLDETVKELGGLHGAANLAGVIGKAGEKAVKDLTDEDWDSVMDVNLRGVFVCMRAELQRMNKDASIVSASSVAGLQGMKMGAPYSTSKHGVIGLTRCAAKDEGHRNIRVNCIAPGPIDTPMIQALVSMTPSKERALDGQGLCLERRGQPEEVAKLIAFLLSDESSYTTGSCYTIDGGLMA